MCFLVALRYFYSKPYGVSPKNGIFAIERNKRRRALKRRCQINRYIHGTILFA